MTLWLPLVFLFYAQRNVFGYTCKTFKAFIFIPIALQQKVIIKNTEIKLTLKELSLCHKFKFSNP